MTDRRSSLKSAGIAHKTYLTARETWKPYGAYVNLDLRQMGLGCVSSFGDHPPPAYLIPAVPYTFEFTMTPVWED